MKHAYTTRVFDGVYWVWVQQEDGTPFSTKAHLMGLPADPLVMRLLCKAKIFRFRVCMKLDKDGYRNVFIPETHAMCLGCMGMWRIRVNAGLIRERDIPKEYQEGGEAHPITSD